MPGPLQQVGTSSVQVLVRADSSATATSLALFTLGIFDDNIKVECLNYGCLGPALSTQEILISLSIYAENFNRVSDSISILFGDDLVAPSTKLLNHTGSLYIYRVMPPNYTCICCLFSRGESQTFMRLVDVSSGKELTRTSFVFWGAPTIKQAAFDSSRIRILVDFDQDTDRALMTPRSTECNFLFDTDELGDGSKCVWQTNSQMVIFLGRLSTLMPGSKITVKQSAGLRSANRVSAASNASAVISKSRVGLLDLVVHGAQAIDPCSELELRASVASPRHLTYFWNCLNDPILDVFLSSMSGPVIRLAAGTPQMQILDKVYSIAISAVDFLDSPSKRVIFNVLKQSTSAPRVQFAPSTLSISRDRSVLIKGLAVFSNCPGAQEDLTFTWRLISGPSDFPARALMTRTPEVYVAPNTLSAGTTYVLGLQTSFRNDVSKVSEGVFVLIVGYQPLVALIDGGSTVLVSVSDRVVLSAANSLDPNEKSVLDSGEPSSLMFAWTCSTLIFGTEIEVENRCHDQFGEALLFQDLPQLVIPPRTLFPSDAPYIFSVTVSKKGRSAASAQVRVFVQEEPVPLISMSIIMCVRADFDQRPCCRTSGGTFIANSESRIVASGTSSMPDTSFEWSLIPNDLKNNTGAPLGYHSNIFVLEGSKSVFSQGNNYVLELRGAVAGALGNVGRTEQVLMINSPPMGGSFTACVIQDDSTSQECIMTGRPIIDEFRLMCSGWTDPEGDVYLSYSFGYEVQDAANNSAPVWFGWVPDFTKDIVLPSGRIVILAVVRDDCGAQSDVMQATVFVDEDILPPSGSSRRLTAAKDFWAIARAKVMTSLQAFRTDSVSQLLSAMAINSAKLTLGSLDSVANSELMMQTLKTSASRVILTSGFMCEALNLAARIAFRYNDLNNASISHGVGLVDLLTNTPVDGGAISVACATSAVTVIGSIMKALVQNQSVADSSGQVLFMQTLELSFKNFLGRMLQGAVAGEKRSAVLARASVISVWKISVSENQKIVQIESPSLFGVHFRPSVRFQVPRSNSLQNDNRVIGVTLQYHVLAPAAGSSTIVSGLFGVDFFLDSTLTPVRALDQPALITIPVNVAYTTKASDFSCLVWNHSFYSDKACNVHSITLGSSNLVSAVICECLLLALHAVSISQVFNASFVSETAYVQGTSIVNISDTVMAGLPSGRPSSPLKKAGLTKPESNLIIDASESDSNNEIIGHDPNLQLNPFSAYLVAGIGVVGVVFICSLLYQIRFYWQRQVYVSENLTESIMMTGKDKEQVQRALEKTPSDDSSANLESFLCFDFDQFRSPKHTDTSGNDPMSKFSSSDFAEVELRPPLPGNPFAVLLPADSIN